MSRSARFPFAIVLSLLLVTLLVPASIAQEESLSGLSTSFEEITKKVRPCVVQIFTTGYGPSRDRSGSSIISKQRGTGSGVILDADGYIITNAHVVQGARNVRVMLPLTEEQRAAQGSILKTEGNLVGGQVVGLDLETDLAVVKVQRKGLPALKLGDSDTVQQGAIVMAYGNPFGLNNSVSMGVVSSTGRQLRPEHPVVYIQTDATINPGNSGGPLVNAKGEVVGINTLIFSQSGGSEGIGFAIPSNIVASIYEQLRTVGRVRRGQIGIYAQTVDPILAAGLGFEAETGVIVGDVYPNSEAAKAGLKIGDVILSLDGKPMENGRQLDVNLYGKVIGNKVKLEVLRDGGKRKIDVVVSQRPARADHFDDLVSPEDNLVDKLGILGISLNPVLNQVIPGLRMQEGVIVAARSNQGPMWRDSFMPGDVIYSVNGARIRSVEDLKSSLNAIRTGYSLVVQIQRGPHLQFLWFQME